MANIDAKTLGKVLREARVAADLSLRELAKRLSITPSYISDIENDRRVPSEEVLGQLAATLNLNIANLMAMAGRVGESAERYLRQHPSAVVLFRKISEKRLAEAELVKLLDAVEKMEGKKGTDLRLASRLSGAWLKTPSSIGNRDR